MKTDSIFDDDQLDLIRDILAEHLEQHPKTSCASEVLDVINVCQQQLGGTEFKDVEQFLNNRSNNWNEIEEEDEFKESDYEAAKAVADFMNGNPDAGLEYWNKYASEHGMVPFDYSDDDWYRNDQYVVSRCCGKFEVVSIDRYDENYI